MTWSARTPTATLSGDITRPVSDGRAFGTARATTAKRSGLRQRSMPLKSTWRSRGAGREDASARTGLSRSHYPWRSGVGFCLSLAVGRAKGRASARLDRQGRAGRASGRQKPAHAARTGRRIAEGNRGTQPEAKEGRAEHPARAGRPELVSAKIHDRLRRSCGRLLCDCYAGRGRTAGRNTADVSRRLRTAALGAELSQDTP